MDIKTVPYSVRLTPLEKGEWDLYCQENKISSLSQLVRNSVTAYLQKETEPVTVDNTPLINRIDQLETVFKSDLSHLSRLVQSLAELPQAVSTTETASHPGSDAEVYDMIREIHRTEKRLPSAGELHTILKFQPHFKQYLILKAGDYEGNILPHLDNLIQMFESELQTGGL